MIRPYTLLRPDFIRGELARVPDSLLKSEQKVAYRLNYLGCP
jgi:hypothetical protein